jgi:DNA polymerase-3 subunit epsilon
VRLRDLLPPLERPFLGFDLETTGTNKQTARIVELGIEIMLPGKPTKEYRTLVNPGIPIPPESTKIHGITDEQVKDAPTFAALADNLLKGFEGADFGGFNVRFDVQIIGAEFKRARKLWSYDQARIIDGFRMWQIAEPRSLDDAVNYWIGHRLMDVNPTLAAEYLREIAEAGKAHGAMRDVLAATRVCSAQLLVMGPDKLPRDVQQLHDLCWPGWYDAEGKLQWRDRQLCIMFGAHREKSLRQVPRDYLHWMATKGDFSEKVKETCRAALRGEYPEAPGAGVEDEDDQLD